MSLTKKEHGNAVEPMLSHINVGSGTDITIGELAQMIARIVGFNGKIEYDKSKPDGPLYKMIDSSKLRNHGWRPSVDLENGLEATYRWFNQHDNQRL